MDLGHCLFPSKDSEGNVPFLLECDIKTSDFRKPSDGLCPVLPEGSLPQGSSRNSPEFEYVLCYLGCGN